MDTYKAAAWLDDGPECRGGSREATGCGIFIPGPVTQKGSLNLTLNYRTFSDCCKIFNIIVFEEAMSVYGER